MGRRIVEHSKMLTLIDLEDFRSGIEQVLRITCRQVIGALLIGQVALTVVVMAVCAVLIGPHL